MSETAAPFSDAYPAPAKLNLMLRVLGRRADGYHLLQTIFRFIDYGDSLRFRVRQDGVIARVNDVAGVPEDSDLTVRAARLLRAHTGTALGADILLEKRLPQGGGLGGGSSDAATALLALNQLWGTALTRTQLIDLSVKLGADVPVFVMGENALGEGIGERLLPLQLPAAWYVVLCPPLMVSTASVFSHPELKRDSQKVRIHGFSALTQGDIDAVAGNDLEALVVRLYPQVARHLAWLSAHGRALMTGSGACVFAAFGSATEAQRVMAQALPDMQGFVAQGLMHHPLRNM